MAGRTRERKVALRRRGDSQLIETSWRLGGKRSSETSFVHRNRKARVHGRCEPYTRPYTTIESLRQHVIRKADRSPKPQLALRAKTEAVLEPIQEARIFFGVCLNFLWCWRPLMISVAGVAPLGPAVYLLFSPLRACRNSPRLGGFSSASRSHTCLSLK